MTEPSRKTGSDLFIVDNSDEDWKVVRYLHQWAEIAHTIDVATGYFEIGALLALDGQWQKLDKIRLLMGDEVSLRTKQAFEAGLANITNRLDNSLEAAKEADDFLTGVPAIVEAIKSGQIEARVYRKRKFHAKAYITYPKLDVVGSAALVGSSNLTYPGLHQNVELNINLRQPTEVKLLQEWYETHWQEAEDVTPDILKTIERHTRAYSPFEVYARAMSAYYQGHQLTVGEWEKHESKMYPILDQYQREGYQQVMKIATNHKGALLCDGVGLGKTFVGLMVIERLLFERKRVALFVPKATRKDVWEAKLRRFLPGVTGRLSNLVIYNHTDLLRGGDYPELMAEVAEKVDAIVVDEAHHFRNLSSDRYRAFFDITEGKELFLLTATPINNSLYDLMHMIELFSRREPAYFGGPPLGIHSLRGHFRRMENALSELVSTNGVGTVDLDAVKAEEALNQDDLFRELVVQRSRAYVRRSLEQQGGRTIAFPERNDPHVANYSLKKTYGGLLDSLEKAFKKDKPLVSLPIYNPINYKLGDDGEPDPFLVGRQTQVVALIRTLLLKRFESSAKAFESSCEALLLKLLYFARLHGPKYAARWEGQHAALISRVKGHLGERGLVEPEDEEEADEDFIPQEFIKKIEKLNDREYQVTDMLLEVMLDLDQLAEFLEELAHFDPGHDDKLQTLIDLLQTHPVLKEHKVLIFTEYMDTARYLAEQLEAAGIGPLIQVDSQKQNQSSAIHAFSPYYNESSSPELKAQGIEAKRVLIATDVLSEGLNLQDATCIINYDLHWNPVRLMQRIGRVDRRLDPAVEKQMLADHPDLKAIRGVVYLWNFLPPAELNQLLSLYHRVTHKTLRISKTFGIEGKKLLTPEDDYDALKNFNEAYEGKTTSAEEMYLAYQQLLQDHAGLMERIDRLPLRVFSGKALDESPSAEARALFLCYRLPAKDAISGEWTEAASITRWYLYDLATETIGEEATRIFEHIRCQPDTPRQIITPKPTLIDIRGKLDKHIMNSYMKKVQAPIGTKSTLLAWMELV